MFAKSHVFLSALALAAASALPLAVHAGETPDTQAAIRAQILGTWKGPPLTEAVVDGDVLDTRERARRAILGLDSPKVTVPLITAAPEPMDIREEARRQILGQPTAGPAVRAEVAVAR